MVDDIYTLPLGTKTSNRTRQEPTGTWNQINSRGHGRHARSMTSLPWVFKGKCNQKLMRRTMKKVTVKRRCSFAGYTCLANLIFTFFFSLRWTLGIESIDNFHASLRAGRSSGAYAFAHEPTYHTSTPMISNLTPSSESGSLPNV